MEQHKVLDLDLDFFLDEIAEYRRDDGPRLSDEEFHPWSADQVRAFLENQCGLSRANPIPGKFVEHHDGAFYWWRELISQGKLTVPFDVAHVDAHSDTGYDASQRYVMTELLHLPVEERSEPRSGPNGLHPGSYLIFALACRWLRQVEYVPHPKSGDDFGRVHFKSNNPTTFAFQLKKCTPDALRGPTVFYGPSRYEPEPEVPFDIKLHSQYCAEAPFTHMLLSQSPGFTPPSADALIPVILEYMTPA